MSTIDIGKAFYHRLANRDKNQGDGKHTAIDFRNRFLASLDNTSIWSTPISDPIVLDFNGVKKIGPSFANEAFGYFTQYAKPKEFLKRVLFINISNVQRMIIEEELDSGYTGK